VEVESARRSNDDADAEKKQKVDRNKKLAVLRERSCRLELNQFDKQNFNKTVERVEVMGAVWPIALPRFDLVVSRILLCWLVELKIKWQAADVAMDSKLVLVVVLACLSGWPSTVFSDDGAGCETYEEDCEEFVTALLT
jgi:hypothetical protein